MPLTGALLSPNSQENRPGQTWRKSGFFILTVLEDGHDPVAQLDRVADFYSAGCRFESCRDRHHKVGAARSLGKSAVVDPLLGTSVLVRQNRTF